MKKIFILVLLMFLEISIAYPQTFKTINIEFTRKIEREDRKETTKGNIYHNGTKTILKITDPIIQWMILEGNSIVIYYPVEKRAIEIKNNSPATLPFLNMFIGIVNEDFGLPELGYSIKKSEMKKDTLFTYWNPPEKDKKLMGPVILALVKNKIVLSESKDIQGKTVIKTIYQNYVSYRTKHIPLKMTIFQFSEFGTTIEEIVFSNPIFNKSFPSEIVNFNIPEGIEPEEIVW